jgi:hypothetical protein
MKMYGITIFHFKFSHKKSDFGSFLIDPTLINEFFRNITLTELKIPQYDDFMSIFSAYKGLRKLTLWELSHNNIDLMIKNGI